MVKLNWEGSANGEQDVYILIAQRMSALKLIGKIHLIRRLVNDKEAGLTFNLHIQDSKLRDPFWVISDVYGYKNYNDVKLCRVKFSDQKWWAIKLPKGSFTGLEEVFFDGVAVNPEYLRWIVKDTGWIVVEDCKSWSSSFSLTSDPDVISFTETDPVFKAHPSYTITQAQINEFHKAVTLNPDLIIGLVLVEQSLGLNLANYESAGAMSPEDKLKLDQLEVGEYYPLNENPAGYLTEEKDPLFKLSPAYLIKSTDIARWNDAYYWGNHANYGYLTSFVETDPIFRSSPAYNINYGQIVQWDEAAQRAPIHKSYSNISVMIADIANQIPHYLYYAQLENNYYEYLGTNNNALSDYRVVDNATTIITTTNTSLPNRSNLQFIRLDAQDDSINDKTIVTRPPAVAVSSTVPTEQILEGDVWINNITWKVYVYYDQFWVETGKNISEFLGTGFVEIDPIFQASVAASITQQDIDNWNNTYNEVLDYRSIFETDGMLYSGYLFNGTPVITRLNNNVLENAINLTNLQLDWTNRLTLTYTA